MEIYSNAKILIEPTKEVGFEVNPNGNEYMVISRKSINGTKQIFINNNTLEAVNKFKY